MKGTKLYVILLVLNIANKKVSVKQAIKMSVDRSLPDFLNNL